MNHLYRVLSSFLEFVLFVFCLAFLISFTGRATVLLFAISAYIGSGFIRRHRPLWIAPAWGIALAGIAVLAVAPVDIKLAPGPPGIWLEQNGRGSISTLYRTAGQSERTVQPVESGNYSCIVMYNAPKWMIVVGTGGIRQEMARRPGIYTELVPALADVDIEGTFLGSYTASSNPDLSPTGVLQLHQTGPAVWGTLTTTVDRTATVSGTIEGTHLSLTFRFTDACKGLAFGTATISNDASRLIGEYQANDCLGKYTGRFVLDLS